MEVGHLQRLPAKHVLSGIAALCHSSTEFSFLKPGFGGLHPFFYALLSRGNFDGKPSLVAQAFPTPRITVAWMG